ncbi:MAG: immunity protein [Solirubrobacteraceae bacterium]|nr:immunity protein [Solirubrobacteraceae bacterium]
MPGWPPRCELTVFPRDSLPRSIVGPDAAVVRALTIDGVPKTWFYAGYASARELRAVDVPPLGRLIRFASSGLGASLLVEPVLGEVVFLVSVRGAVPIFVNSSLAQFTATARALVDRYPYYALTATVEQIDAAAADVAAIVASIDAPALGAELYWTTFVEDMRAGAFASELLTGE